MAGQPTKYRPEMCKTVIELMKDGASIVEVCAELDIDRQTFYNWSNPEHGSFQKRFFDTVRRGLTLAQAWYERQGRKNLSNREFNAQLFKFQMINKFPKDWADKKQVEANVKTQEITLDLGEPNPEENDAD